MWCRAHGVWGLPCGVLLAAVSGWRVHTMGPLQGAFPAIGPIVVASTFLQLQLHKGLVILDKLAALRLKVPEMWGLLNPD